MKLYNLKQEKNHETYQSDEKDKNFDKKLTNTAKIASQLLQRTKGFCKLGQKIQELGFSIWGRLCKREREKEGKESVYVLCVVWLYYEDKEEERVKVGMMSLGFDSQRQAQILMKGVL